MFSFMDSQLRGTDRCRQWKRESETNQRPYETSFKWHKGVKIHIIIYISSEQQLELVLFMCMLICECLCISVTVHKLYMGVLISSSITLLADFYIETNKDKFMCHQENQTVKHGKMTSVILCNFLAKLILLEVIQDKIQLTGTLHPQSSVKTSVIRNIINCWWHLLSIFRITRFWFL